MPHSLVLNLLPQSPIFPQFLTGRHLHALFLTLVSSVDKKLGDRLHESTADKAFTLSPLQVQFNISASLDVKERAIACSFSNCLQASTYSLFPAVTFITFFSEKGSELVALLLPLLATPTNPTTESKARVSEGSGAVILD